MVVRRSRPGCVSMRQPRSAERCQRGARQLEGDALVRRLGQHAAARALQAFGDALAHLAGRLVGEGDGDDFLGLVGDRQQAQVALRQQLGLAGAGRRLDDEGFQFQRAAAVGVVFGEQVKGHGS
jgi:hypothetical protein